MTESFSRWSFGLNVAVTEVFALGEIGTAGNRCAEVVVTAWVEGQVGPVLGPRASAGVHDVAVVFRHVAAEIVRRAGRHDAEGVQKLVHHCEVERVRPEPRLEPIALTEVGDGHRWRTEPTGARGSGSRLSVVVDGVYLRTVVEAARLELPDDGRVRVGIDDLLAGPVEAQERDVGLGVERVDPQRGAVRVLTEPAVPRRDGRGDLPVRIERTVGPIGGGHVDDVDLGTELLVRPILN